MLTTEQVDELRASSAAPNRVKLAMQLARLRQTDAAQRLGLTQAHISDVANGNYKQLPLETARRFATLFGCAIEDLFPANVGDEAAAQ